MHSKDMIESASSLQYSGIGHVVSFSFLCIDKHVKRGTGRTSQQRIGMTT